MLGPRKATALVLAATVIAVLCDTLLQGVSWGVNIGILTVIVAGLIAWLSKRTPLQLTDSGQKFGALAIVFALLFSVRDSNALKIANGLALVLCWGGMLLPLTVGRLKEAYLGNLLLGSIRQLFGLPKEVFDLGRKTVAERKEVTGNSQRGKSILRGLLIAVPLLLVFGGLFASADAIFRSRAASLLSIDLDAESLNGHFWTLLFGFMMAGGLLHRLILTEARSNMAVDRLVKGNSVGMIEVGIVLGSLNLLFASFIAIQFRYLFGAESMVKATTGLSYSEYARSGFFELVWVAALALGVLLGAEALLKKEGEREVKIYQWMGRGLVAMVFCVVGSAVLRMKLYTDQFGLTELRVYSTVFMIWLTLALGWLLFTTLNRRPQRFAFGTMLSGLMVIFGTNWIDPDALIVRTNLSKPGTDFAYLATLSDDAVLALRRMGDTVPAVHREETDALIKRRRAGVADSDWREMNLSRSLLLR
jgi:hypothetical protein